MPESGRSGDIGSDIDSWRVADEQSPALLARALATADWAAVAGIIETDWLTLYLTHRELLREAYAVTPPRAFGRTPGARAVREFLFPVAVPVPDASLALLPADPAHLQDLAVSADAAEILRASLAGLIALRVRGDWFEAHQQADRLRLALEIAQREHLDAVAASVPSTQLQLGITYLLLGEHALAIRHLQRAHRNRDLDRLGYVGRDSAAKLALAHALRGDVHAAASWLAICAGEVTADVSSRIDLASSELTAGALVTVQSLDRERARQARDRLHHGLVDEELWAFRMHALVRIGILLGDTLGAQRLVHGAEETLPYARPQPDGVRALLLGDRVDLLVAAGAADRAEDLLDDTPLRSPQLDLCQGRVALLLGDAETALQRAEAVLREGPLHPLAEGEALVLAAVAEDRLGRRSSAAERLRLALEGAADGGPVSGLATVPGAELSALAAATDLRLPDDIPQLYPSRLAVVHLTRRETAVLRQLAAGRYLSEIAAADFVSINTIKSQVRSIYRKLGAHGRKDALQTARSVGLL